MKINNSITELIGRTPLLRLRGIEREYGLPSPLIAKLECMNPAGSAKDRVGLSMILRAEEQGMLKPGATIIEPTSGNTGIGLAAVAASRGYRVILTMPESMSLERRRLLAAYGAEIVLTPAAEGMTGAVKRAEEIAASTPGAFLPGQFDNPNNPRIHFETTGPEIYEDTDGELAAFVATVGTGGTLSGVGRFLKGKDPSIRIIAVEPSDSPLLSRGTSGPHRIQGIGANFVPKNFDRSVADQIRTVSTEDAFSASRILARADGILCGISSGAAIAAAVSFVRECRPAGPTVVLLPDTGERYLSSGLFE